MVIVPSVLTVLLSAVTVQAVSPLVNLDYSSYQGTALPGGITQWLGMVSRTADHHVSQSNHLPALRCSSARRP